MCDRRHCILLCGCSKLNGLINDQPIEPSQRICHLKLLSLLHEGRAGITWRARAVFRTRSQFAPQMTPTRRPGSACRRWRKTYGAVQQSRSSRGQVRFCFNSCLYILLCVPASVNMAAFKYVGKGQITGALSCSQKASEPSLLNISSCW